jgi:hypothetical protein
MVFIRAAPANTPGLFYLREKEFFKTLALPQAYCYNFALWNKQCW